MGKLVRPGHVAAGENIGEAGAQEAVHRHGAVFLGGDVHGLQAQAVGVGAAAHRHQHRVERQALLAVVRLHVQHLFAVLHRETRRLMVGEHGDAAVAQGCGHQGGGVFVLAGHQARQHLHLGHLAAQAREALRQLTADRPAAQHDQPAGLLRQGPQVFGGENVDLVDTGDRRHERPRAGGDNNIAGGQGALALGGVHGDFPGRGDARAALHAIHAQLGVTLHRIVGLDLADHLMDARHDVGEIEARRDAGEAVALRLLLQVRQPRALDQCLGRHAAGIQAVAAHLAFLDQRDTGFHRGGDIGAHQPGGAGADHHQIAVEVLRLLIAPVHLARLQKRHHRLRQPGEQPQQHEGADQIHRQQAGQAVQLAQLSARVHIHRRTRQHPRLADPVKRPSLQRRQAHHQIDHEKRKRRNQTQRKQIKGAVLRHARVDLLQPLTEAALHRVLEQKPRRQKGQGRAHTGRERHQHQRHPEPEQRARRQRHDRRSRQTQRRHRHIQQKEPAQHQHRLLRRQRLKRPALRLQIIQAQILPQIKHKIRRHQRRDHAQQSHFLNVHSIASLMTRRSLPRSLSADPGAVCVGDVQNRMSAGMRESSPHGRVHGVFWTSPTHTAAPAGERA